MHGICHTDEDGISRTTYTDAFDRKVLERRGNDCDTYFVYDDLGRLAYVLQPMYQHEANVDKYAYQYEYDLRRNLTKKKLPGCDAIEYVYDKYNRCVSIQDGELRRQGKYRIMLYDNIGRLALQGLSTYLFDSDSIGIVSYEYNSRGVCGTDYRTTNTKCNIDKLEIVNYYDDYCFLNGTNKAQFQGINRPDSSESKGQLSGILQCVSNGEMIAEVYAYDILGNKIETQSRMLGGSIATQKNSYTYTNKIATSTYTIQPISSKTLTYSIRNEYSTKNDALLGITYQAKVDTAAIKYWTLRYQYDNHGRVSAIYRPKDVLQFKEDYKYRVRYGYDIHGWTNSISGNSFSERIYYDAGQGTPMYNGNISSVAWENGSTLTKGYRYTYDSQNRLMSAEYGERNFASRLGRYDENVGYNSNGSITQIIRNGLRQDDTYGAIDSLRLEYNGNQLKSVSELASPILYANSTDVKKSSDDIQYNSNGSLTKDGSREIVSIDYDDNNNPKQILFANGNMTRYVYSAAGQKLRTIHYTSFSGKDKDTSLADVDEASVYLSVDTTDYVLDGMLVYSNGRFARLQFDGGILWANYMQATHLDNPIQKQSKSQTANTAIDKINTMTLHLGFYYKDHLGNNRAVVDEQGKTIQSIDYYPYGMPYLVKRPSLQANKLPYKYNGKELDQMSGLNTYDYGGRQYYSAIPMWDRVDPLCEDYYPISPYAYCLGRPTILIDLEGYKPTLKEAARIAAHVYGDENVRLIGGWKVSKRKIDNVSYVIGKYGFKSNLYERTINGKTEYVYATAGTDGLSMKDWKNNIQQLDGNSKQYKTSIDNAENLSNQLKKYELTFVGHSLGGGLAAANAYKTGRDAMTFNAAWVSPKTILNRHGAIVEAYIIDGDELDFVQRKILNERANGNVHIIAKPGRLKLGHSIGNFYSDEDLYEQKIKNAQWQYIINQPNLPFVTY